MNLLDIIKQVTNKSGEEKAEVKTDSELESQISVFEDKDKEKEKEEETKIMQQELQKPPSVTFSNNILPRSSFEHCCRRKNYLSSITLNKALVLSKLTDEDIYVIFQNNNRPVSDNQYLVTYLSNLHPFYESIVEARGDKANDIIKNISFMLKFYSESKDSIIFRSGERDERCFIILEGQVVIISDKEEYIKMTDEEYIHYLIQLRSVGEIELLKEVIDANNESFAIEERSFDNWIRVAYKTIHSLKDKRPTRKGDIYDKKKGMIRRKSLQNISTKTFETKKLKSLVLSLENDIIRLYNQIEFESTTVISNNEAKSQCISAEDFIYRIKPLYNEKSIFLLDLEKKGYKIKTYFISQTLSRGEIFGEVLTDGIHAKVYENTKRTSTAITAQHTKCAYLTKEAFYDLLRLTLEKLRRDKINFLFELGIFAKANKNVFIKNYSNCVKKKIINDQTILFAENEVIGKDHFVYFIQSGQFQASCVKSIHDIDEVIKEKSPEVSNELFEKEYMRKKEFKLAIFGSNDIIGLEDSFHQGKYLFTLKCVSIQGVIFEFHYEFFQALMMSDATVKSRTEDLQLVKIDIRNKLLKQQKEVRLQFLYTRVLNREKEKKPTAVKRLMMLPNQNKDIYCKLNNRNNLLDIDNALRDEVSSTRAHWKRRIITAHHQNRSLLLRNNNIIQLKTKVPELSDRLPKGIKTIDRVDRIKRELLKQKTQMIKLDVSANITNPNIITNTNTNTVSHTKNSNTIDNESIVYLGTESNSNNDQQNNTNGNTLNMKNIGNRREVSQINPLAYDNFERRYNTGFYFNIIGYDRRMNKDKYYLRLTDSNLVQREIKRERVAKTKPASLYKTINYNKTPRSLMKETPTSIRNTHCNKIKWVKDNKTNKSNMSKDMSR